MRCDIFSIAEFFQSPQGKEISHLINNIINKVWPQLENERILFCGYPHGVWPTPPLKTYVLVFNPAQLGSIIWPLRKENRTVLIDEEKLPLADASIDKIILLNTLEHVYHPKIFMREIWRVLKGEGRILTFVPNRQSLWSHSDTTPFGYGRPFTRGQLEQLLKDHFFTCERTFNILDFFPSQSVIGKALSKVIVKAYPSVGGVIVNESIKKIYAQVKQARPQSILQWAVEN